MTTKHSNKPDNTHNKMRTNAPTKTRKTKATSTGKTKAQHPNQQLSMPDIVWQPDVLGDGFQNTTLKTVDDAQITLVRYLPDAAAPSNDKIAVLYVHGFSDYFFQTHLAAAITEAGYAFFAVDLRGYGRSMASHMEAGGDPNMVPELAVHSRDLDAAVAAVRASGYEKVILMAHSMGGLVASLWASTRPGRVDAMVLNAPWFDLNESAFLRGPGTAAIKVLAEVAPTVVVGGLKPHYGKALHKDTGGQWDYNLDWKPLSGFPVQAGWMASVRRAHERLNAGLDIDIPVLVLASTRSGSAKMWHPRLTATDSVLDVEHIAKGAAALGSDVTFVQIAGGAHDLALSHTPAAREDYLSAVTSWLGHLYH